LRGFLYAASCPAVSLCHGTTRRSSEPASSVCVAAALALPHANQIADRWHLKENARHSFLNAVRKSMR